MSPASQRIQPERLTNSSYGDNIMPVLILDASIQKFAKAIDLDIARVVERIALDLWNKITLRTPVDTGAARRSWQLGVGQPNTFVPSESGKGTGANKDKSSPPSEPSPDFPSDVEITGKDTVYITSSLGYIEALEEGHSKQAPAGMVQISIAEVQAEIELILEAGIT